VGVRDGRRGFAGSERTNGHQANTVSCCTLLQESAKNSLISRQRLSLRLQLRMRDSHRRGLLLRLGSVHCHDDTRLLSCRAPGMRSADFSSGQRSADGECASRNFSDRRERPWDQPSRARSGSVDLPRVRGDWLRAAMGRRLRACRSAAAQCHFVCACRRGSGCRLTSAVQPSSSRKYAGDFFRRGRAGQLADRRFSASAGIRSLVGLSLFCRQGPARVDWGTILDLSTRYSRRGPLLPPGLSECRDRGGFF